MAWCEECRVYIDSDTQHCFAGYGWYMGYCGKCCPRVMDGSECGKDHDYDSKVEDTEGTSPTTSTDMG